MLDLSNETPVLFVNVDGVLTSARTYWLGNRQPPELLDPIALKLLENFRRRLNARLIIASQWSRMFYKTPDDWVRCFSASGYDIPVDGILLRASSDRTWADEMDALMSACPHIPHVLFEDDPEFQSHPRIIEVDARVGLTTIDLQKAADLLAPGSDLAYDLGALNKSFSRAKSIGISFNGKAVEVHPRGLAKGLDALGATDNS